MCHRKFMEVNSVPNKFLFVSKFIKGHDMWFSNMKNFVEKFDSPLKKTPDPPGLHPCTIQKTSFTANTHTQNMYCFYKKNISTFTTTLHCIINVTLHKVTKSNMTSVEQARCTIIFGSYSLCHCYVFFNTYTNRNFAQ